MVRIRVLKNDMYLLNDMYSILWVALNWISSEEYNLWWHITLRGIGIFLLAMLWCLRYTAKTCYWIQAKLTDVVQKLGLTHRTQGILRAFSGHSQGILMVFSWYSQGVILRALFSGHYSHSILRAAGRCRCSTRCPSITWTCMLLSRYQYHWHEYQVMLGHLVEQQLSQAFMSLVIPSANLAALSG